MPAPNKVQLWLTV